MEELNLEMIEFFKQEANSHIIKVNNFMLAVEKDGGNTDTFSKMKGEMHTLKGDARMMGLLSISEASHKVEDLFEGLVKSNKLNDPELLKDIFKALDAIENAVKKLPEKLDEIDLSFIKSEKKETQNIKKQEVEIFEEEKPGDKKPQASGLKEITAAEEKKDSKEIQKPDEKNDTEGQKEMKEKEEEKKETVQESRTEYLNINLAKIDELITLSGTFVRYHGLFNYILNKMYQLALDIGETNSFENEQAEKTIENIIYDFSKNLAFFDITARQFQDEITNLKLVPLSTIFDLLPRLVRDVAESTKKSINFVIEGKDVELDKIIVDKLKTILIHILRNAVDHGCESPDIREKKGKPKEANVILKAFNRGDNIEIDVSDDGSGLDIENIRSKAVQKGLIQENKAFSLTDEEVKQFIFKPGFSTKEVGAFSGRGVGMDVVATSVKELNGDVKVLTAKDKGTTFHITLPLISSFIPITTILLNDTLYGIPSSYIKIVQRTLQGDVKETGSGQLVINMENLDISLIDLQVFFGLGEGEKEKNKNIVIVKYQDEVAGFIVSEVIQEKKMVIKKISGISEKCNSIIGAVLGDMRVIPVLNIPELFRMLKSGNINIVKAKEERRTDQHMWEKNVLLVEDSALTRSLEKKILLNHNLNVFEAANGQEALEFLNKRSFDLIITDIEMPVMNGVDLVSNIRKKPELSGIPIIIVSSYKMYEQKLAEMGADYFIGKGDFTTQTLLGILVNEKIL